jgi:oligoendopeptidase F
LHSQWRSKGNLTSEDIGDIWIDTQVESIGPEFNIAGEFRFWWSHVLHFVRDPFCTYAYSFGTLLAMCLYATHVGGRDKAFADKVIDFFRGGGAKSHRALLSPFGFDASEPLFWEKGLIIIERMVDDIAQMDR